MFLKTEMFSPAYAVGGAILLVFSIFIGSCEVLRVRALPRCYQFSVQV